MQPVFNLLADDSDLDDLPSEEIDPTTDAEPPAPILAIHRADQEQMAWRRLDRFFSGRHLPCGVPVTSEMTHTTDNLALLIGPEPPDPRVSRFNQRVDLIYEELGVEVDPADLSGTVTWDVRFLLAMFKECAALGIPKPIAPGVILIYVRLCRPHLGLRVAN